MNRQNKPEAGTLIASRPKSGPDGPGADPSTPINGNGSHRSAMVGGFFDRLIRFFSSLRLTVVCLGIGLVLVF